VPKVKKVHDALAMIESLYRRQRAETYSTNLLAAERLNTERMIGEYLEKSLEHGGDRKSRSSDSTLMPRLNDLGLSKYESSQWQKLAAVDEQDFRTWIDEQIKTNREITTSGALKVANHVIRDQTEEQTRDALAAIGESLAKGNDLPVKVELVSGDFRDCLAQLPADSIDLIFTEPPSDWDTVRLYADLAQHAASVLKPGGHLLVFAGNHSLPEILTAMAKHLRYCWILGVKHSAGSAGLPNKWVYVEWKPLLWFVKGEYGNMPQYVVDLFEPAPPNKSSHRWAQDQNEASYYLSRLTDLGATVADPFMSSGTTLAAAVTLGRNVWGCDVDAQNIPITRATIQAAVEECLATTENVK
jgi:hypothetical protein